MAIGTISVGARGPTGALIGRLGMVLAYGALVTIFLLFGLSRFTSETAQALIETVGSSPLLGWVYSVMAPETFSRALGMVELAIGVLIASRPFSPRASTIGGVLAAGVCLVTLSFILTTPGVIDTSRGVFGFFGNAGHFLIKDFGLLALSLMVASESIGAARRL